MNAVVEVFRDVEFAVVDGKVHRPAEFARHLAGLAELALEMAIEVENLDAAVARIGNKHLVARNGDSGRIVEQRVHSRYTRRPADLPVAGRPVRLELIARRFRCEAVLCGRRIFVERFDPNVLAPSARRTARLECLVHHLGLALGGRPAAAMARRLMLPVSNDTLLQV